MKNIQHKQSRPAPRDYGFDDAGAPAALAWPEIATTTPEDALLDALEDAGARFDDRARAADIAADAIERHGDRRAADELCRIFEAIPGGRRGAEMRAALLGGLDNAQAMADEFDTSRQNWHQRVNRLRSRLLDKNVDSTHTCKGSNFPAKTDL